MDEIVVGRLMGADREQWEKLLTGYLEFYERSITAADYDRAWDAFAADDVLHARGAHLDGELVGIVQFLIHPSTTTPDVCYLQDLFTAPEARGHGVATRLIKEVETWAREQGCFRLYWRTHHTNARARRVYDQVADDSGFIVYQIAL